MRVFRILCVVALLVAFATADEPISAHDIETQLTQIQAEARETGYIDEDKLGQIRVMIAHSVDLLQADDSDDASLLNKRLFELNAHRSRADSSKVVLQQSANHLLDESKHLSDVISSLQTAKDTATSDLKFEKDRIQNLRNLIPDEIENVRLVSHQVFGANQNLSIVRGNVTSLRLGNATGNFLEALGTLRDKLTSYHVYEQQDIRKLQDRLVSEEVTSHIKITQLEEHIQSATTQLESVGGMFDGIKSDLEQQMSLVAAMDSSQQTQNHLQQSAQGAYDRRRSQRSTEISNLRALLDLVTVLQSDTASTHNYPAIPSRLDQIIIMTQVKIPTTISSETFSRNFSNIFSKTVRVLIGQRIGALPKEIVSVESSSVDEEYSGIRVTIRMVVDIDKADDVIGAWSADIISTTFQILHLSTNGPVVTTRAPLRLNDHAPFCPNDCSSHGMCQTTGRCACVPDWTGEDCSRPRCASGCLHGECVSPDICQCAQGFIGKSCSIPITCPVPLPSSNQRVECDGDGVGSSCVYYCADGYQLSHTAHSMRICEPSGHWSSPAPICIPVTCGAPPSIHNGFIDCTGHTLGSTCQFNCREGFETSDDISEIVCQGSGQWSGERASRSCQLKECSGLPAAPGNGSMECSGSVVGAVCQQTCSVGYHKLPIEHSEESLSITPLGVLTCTKHLIWEGTPIQCNAVNCDELGSPVKGGVVCSGNRFNDVCNFTCDEGYIIPRHSSQSRTCQSTGTWSGLTTQCVPINCGHPTASQPLPNGHYMCSGTILDSICQINCDAGFHLSSNIPYQRVCQADGSWSGEVLEDVACVKHQCLLPTVDHGKIECSGQDVGDMCSVTCDQGFILTDNSNMSLQLSQLSHLTCYADGWDPLIPSCQPTTCSNLPEPSNGRLICLTNDHNETTCEVRCQDGFMIDGHDHVMCGVNGQWNAPLGTCIPVQCGSAPILPRSPNPECSGSDFNARCNYSCVTVDLDTPSILNIDISDPDANDFGARVFENQRLHITATSQSAQQQWHLVPLSETQELSLKFLEQSSDSLNEGAQVGASFTTFVLEAQGEAVEDSIVLHMSLYDLSNVAIRNISVKIEISSPSQFTETFSLICDLQSDWRVENQASEICTSRLKPSQTTAVQLPNVKMTCGWNDLGIFECHHACDVGFDLVGSPVRQFISGIFTGQRSRCVPHVCDQLNIPEHGVAVHCDGGVSLGAKCTVDCARGYKPSPFALERKCSHSGWTGGSLTCVRAQSCAPFVPPPNSYVECSPTTQLPLSVCHITCLPGFNPETDTPSTSACIDGEWTESSINCIPVLCPEPERFENGNVSWTGLMLHDSASYFCDQGYTLVGSQHITCLLGGVWSSSPPQCHAITCPIHTIPAHGTAHCDGYGAGSTCHVTCDVGYVLKGPQKRACGYDGTWTGSSQICESVNCFHLESSDNSMNVSCTGSKYLDRCVLGCSDGYQIVGSSIRMCDANGMWTGPPAVCKPIRCSKLPVLSFGSVECSGQDLGSVCNLKCDEGFQLVGHDVRECTESGKWTGSPAFCLPIDCGSLTPPPHGHITCDNGTSFQSQCTFSCLKGYHLEGSSTRTCNAVGIWSGSHSICSPADCGVLNPPTHGHLECTGSSVMDHCLARCDVGHYLVSGDVDRTCGSDSKWTGVPAVCHPKQCAPLSLESGLNVYCSGGSTDHSFGSTCHFSCQLGKRLIGSPVRSCMGDGAWSGLQPSCEVVDCGMPSVPADKGLPECSGYSFNSTCSVECVKDKQTIMRCEADGQWSQTQGPPCTYISCAPPSLPPGVLHSCPNGAWLGKPCPTSCDVANGFIQVTSWPHLNPDGGEIVCTDGKWIIGTPIHCAKPFCYPLPPVDNGDRDCSGHSIGDICKTKCAVGFKAVPRVIASTTSSPSSSSSSSSSHHTSNHTTSPLESLLSERSDTGLLPGERKCLDPHSGSSIGDWEGVDIECAPIQCDLPPIPVSGHMRCTGNSYGDTCYSECNAFHTIENNTRTMRATQRFCDHTGIFTGKDLECEEMHCGVLHDLGGAIAVCDLSKKVPATNTHTCELVCPVGKSGGGAITCGPGGWSGHHKPCVPMPCGIPVDPPNGQYFCTSGYQYGSHCIVKCKPGFTLLSPTVPEGVDASIECSANGTWAGHSSVCVPTECSRPQIGNHVTIECTGGSVGDHCVAGCDDGFNVKSSLSLVSVCDQDGVWSEGLPTCIGKSCSPLQLDDHITAVCSGLDDGDSCILSCDTGFQGFGSPFHTCNNGNWEGSQFECQPTHCTPPNSPDHSKLSCGPLPAFLDTCSVTCEDNYSMTPKILAKKTSHVCLDDGSWSNNGGTLDVSCQPITCPALHYSHNTVINCTQEIDASVGTVCHVTCKPGFVFADKRESIRKVCELPGIWSPFNEPECIPVTCSQFEGPNLSTHYCSGYSYGDTCTSSCSSGYVMTRPATRPGDVQILTQVNVKSEFIPFMLVDSTVNECDQNGRWTGGDEWCTVIKCPLPPAPANGKVSCRGEQVGSECSFSCNSGTRHIGPYSKVCSPSGHWYSDEEVICEAVTCGEAPMPLNSTHSEYTTTYGSLVTVECDDGFELVGAKTRACSESGSWTGPPPTCQPIDCGMPANPELGSVECSQGTSFGSSCTYHCLQQADETTPHAILVDRQVVCSASRQWQPTTNNFSPCHVIKCPSLPQPSNGHMTCTDTTCHSIVCEEGYELQSDVTLLQCVNGMWEGTFPVCAPSSCPALHTPNFASIHVMDFRTIRITCAPGYRLPFDMSRWQYTRMCSNGEWSGDDLIACEALSCGPPSPLLISSIGTLERPQGSHVPEIQLIGGMKFHSVALYHCESSFTLVGSASRVCQDNGQWSGSPATCVPRTCQPPTTPDGFSLVNVWKSEYLVGETITIRCESGHRMIGSNFITCMQSGVWSLPAAICTEIDCGVAPSVPNSVWSCDGSHFGHKCTYTCIGDKSVSSTIECSTSNSWIGSLPQCPFPTCPVPLTPRNGRIVCANGHVLGSKCDVMCDVGYDLYRSSDDVVKSDVVHVMCDNEQWSGDLNAVCKPHTCDPYPALPFVIATCTEQECVFRCENGYQLSGAASVACEANGWSSEIPECSVITCPSPLLPVHAVLRSSLDSVISVGSKVRVGCVPGYEVQTSHDVAVNDAGEIEMECTPNRSWLNSDLECVPEHCVLPIAPLNGQITVDSGDLRIGSTITIHCNRPYRPSDPNATRECIGTSGSPQWSGNDISCIDSGCSRIPTVNNSHVICSDGGETGHAVIGSQCQYTCDQGYHFISSISSSIRTCDDIGRWTGSPPVCSPFECHVPVVAHGLVRCPNGPTFNESCILVCEPGFLTVSHTAATSLSCTDTAEWSIPTVCAPAQCPELSPVNNGHFHVSGDGAVQYGHVVTYECDEGFQLIGSASRTCMQSAEWDPEEPPTCQRVECMDPTDLIHNDPHRQNIRVTCSDSLYVYQTSCEVSCDIGFQVKLSDPSQALVVNCDGNGMWSNDLPVCSPVDCGVPIDFNTSHIHMSCDGTHYNHACIFSCPESSRIIEGNSIRTCQANGTWSGTAPVCSGIQAPVVSNILTKPAVASQSSTLGEFGAQKALVAFDGECSSTTAENQPWWQVNLGVIRRIDDIEITFTSPAISPHNPIRVFTGLTQDTSHHTSQCYVTSSSSSELNHTLTLACGHTLAQYITVQSDVSGALVMCDVKVWNNHPEEWNVAPLILSDISKFKPMSASVPMSRDLNNCWTLPIADNPSISIDLQLPARISNVLITMADTTASQLSVSVASGLEGSHTLCEMPKFARSHGSVSFDCSGLEGTHITITSHGWSQQLSICDVMVWGTHFVNLVV